MSEREYIGEIDSSIFKDKVEDYTARFGSPTFKKRLGLMVFDRNSRNVDTRVRITNGNAEVMQKVKEDGDGLGTSTKKEISIPLSSDVDTIYNAYITYFNLLRFKYSEHLISLAVQTENYIWDLTDLLGVELKLSKQFGINDYYTFEIEAIKEGVDLENVRGELGINPTENHASEERSLFRSTMVDLNLVGMSEEGVKDIIREYL